MSTALDAALTVADRLAALHPRDRERVTTRAFTETLRSQHGEDIRAEVVRVAPTRADTAAAGHLRVPPGTEVLARHALLRTAPSRRVVAYGHSLVVAGRLPPGARDTLARADRDATPLGDVLGVACRDRVILGWAVGAEIPHRDARPVAEACRPGRRLVSRHSVIGGDEGPLALVGEWWPEAGPEAPVPSPRPAA